MLAVRRLQHQRIEFVMIYASADPIRMQLATIEKSFDRWRQMKGGGDVMGFTQHGQDFRIPIDWLHSAHPIRDPSIGTTWLLAMESVSPDRDFKGGVREIQS